MPRIAAIVSEYAQNATAPPPAGATRAEAKAMLTDELVLGYRPNLPGAGFWNGSSDTPNLQQMIQDVEPMLAHSRVQASLGYYKSGIAAIETEIEASSADVAKWAEKELKHFWGSQRLTCQLSYNYGRGGFEPIYKEEDGLLGLACLKDFFPLDTSVLTRKDQYCGIRVRGGHDNGKTKSAIDLWGPRAIPAKGFWLSHNRRYSRWYGWPQGYGAWRPWRRLAGRDGAEEIVDGGVYRFAFKPPIGRYPAVDEMPRMSAGNTGQAYGAGNGMGQPPSNRDKMREMLELMKSGGVVAMSSRRDENGELVWDVEFPEHALEVTGLLLYTTNLEKAISLGVGVPPELIEASEVGSGYSGRAIPMQAFFWGQQTNAEELIEAWREQIGLPCARWNFGPQAWFKVHLKPLLQTAMKAAGGTEQSKPSPQAPESPAPARQPGQDPPQLGGRPDPAPAPTGQRFATRAPVGGVTIGGKKYTGGEFIPDEAVAAATPEEKAQVEGKPAAAKTSAKTAPAHAEEQLRNAVAEMEKSPQGQATLARGHALAARVKIKVAEGVQKAIDGLDAGSGGGLSLLAGSLKSQDPVAAAAGASRLVSTVYSCVHEEMFELLLSQQTGGPAFAAKLAAKGAAKAVVMGEQGLFKAAVWAVGKLRGAAASFATDMGDTKDLTAGDHELLGQLAAIAQQALAEIYEEAGVSKDALPATEQVTQRLLGKLRQNGKNFATNPEGEQRSPFPAGDDVQDSETQQLLDALFAAFGDLAGRIEEEIDQAIAQAQTPAEGYASARQILEQYQPELVQALTASELGSILVGMGQVARRLPAFPPSPLQESPPPALLPAHQADALLLTLRSLPPSQQSAFLDALQPDVAAWARPQLQAAAGGGSQPPAAGPPQASAADLPEDIRLPLVDAAVADLRARQVLSKDRFDALAGDARRQAFTVAGIESEATLAKIQQALADVVEEGASLPAFREKVQEALGEGTLLSPAHMELVYRNNVQQAYSAGQDEMLAHPIVATLFPYEETLPIADSRETELCRIVSRSGIQGTAIFRADDPVWQKLKPPRHHGCRCGRNALTLEQAAAKGIREAQEWLRTGQPPTLPAWVPMPALTPEAQRTLDSYRRAA